MLQSMYPKLQNTTTLSNPILSTNSTVPISSINSTSDTTDDESPQNSYPYINQDFNFKINSCPQSYKSLAILSGHIESVSCLALCGEFILSASNGKDIILWQLPHLKKFTKFGQGDGSIKALITSGNRVFTAHQDSKIRVWKVSKSSENVFRLVNTLPTTKDYLGNFMNQSNYIQTRRHHKRLWIEHSDTISCLAASNGTLYSGSWDKSLRVWRISDFKCLESIKAHDDAINGLVVSKGIVYSASADGKVKAWGVQGKDKTHSLKGIMEGHKGLSMNCVVVSEDGRFVYGGGSDGYVMGWLGNGEFDSVCEVKAHKMAVLCMCLVMVGEGDQYLCSGSADKSICVWKREVEGGLVRQMVIEGHGGPVKCLQGLEMRVGGGFMLYSGSLDTSVRVWWVSNCQEEDDANASLSQIKEKESAVQFLN